MRLSSFILFNLAITLIFFCLGFQNMISAFAFNTFVVNTMGTEYSNNGTTSTTGYNATSTNMDSMTPSALNPVGIVTRLAQTIISDQNTILALGLGALVAAGLAFTFGNFLSGFTANFLVPILIIVVIFNFFFFPFGLIFDQSIPAFLKFFVFSIYNTIMIISAIDFVRGGM